MVMSFRYHICTSVNIEYSGIGGVGPTWEDIITKIHIEHQLPRPACGDFVPPPLPILGQGGVGLKPRYLAL